MKKTILFFCSFFCGLLSYCASIKIPRGSSHHSLNIAYFSGALCKIYVSILCYGHIVLQSNSSKRHQRLYLFLHKKFSKNRIIESRFKEHLDKVNTRFNSEVHSFMNEKANKSEH